MFRWLRSGVSVVPVVSFRWFSLGVSGFSTCRELMLNSCDDLHILNYSHILHGIGNCFRRIMVLSFSIAFI